MTSETPSPLVIRQATDDDLDAIALLWHTTARATYTFIELEQTYTLDDHRTYFLSAIAPRCEIWLAERAETADARIVGYLALEKSYIDRLYVHPNEQGRGVGTALLQQAMALHPDGLELHTHLKNTGARGFYERHGFRAVRFGVSPPPESEPDVEYHWRP